MLDENLFWHQIRYDIYLYVIVKNITKIKSTDLSKVLLHLQVL